jgi:hypothetical protein
MSMDLTAYGFSIRYTGVDLTTFDGEPWPSCVMDNPATDNLGLFTTGHVYAGGIVLERLSVGMNALPTTIWFWMGNTGGMWE